MNIDAKLRAQAIKAAEKASYTVKEWKPSIKCSLKEYITDYKDPKMKYADFEGMATLKGFISDKGKQFYKIAIPLEEGGYNLVAAGKYTLENYEEDDEFPVAEIKAVFITCLGEGMWVFNAPEI